MVADVEIPVFEGSPGHWTNENNDDVRFDTDTHRRVVLGLLKW